MGAACSTCNKKLAGNWTSSEGAFSKRQCLGITNGYFLNGNSPNFVNSYCHDCWKIEVKKLPFVHTIQQELNQANNQLITVQQELIHSKDELLQTKNQLSTVEEELIHSKEELLQTKNQLSTIEEELIHTKEELLQTKNQLSTIEEELIHSKEELLQTKNQLAAQIERNVVSKQQLISVKQELANANLSLKNSQQRNENIPKAIIQSFNESSFHMFDKICLNFSESESELLVNECGFSGWKNTLNAITNGFKRVLDSCISNAVSDLSKCILKRSEILQQKKKSVDQMIHDFETRMNSENTPLSVIEQSVQSLKAHKAELGKECERWTQLQIQTQELVNSTKFDLDYNLVTETKH